MFSLRTRLLGLVLGPALVALGFAGVTTTDRLTAARAAAQVADDVAHVVDLVEAQSSLVAARIPAEMAARIADNATFEGLSDGLLRRLNADGPGPQTQIAQASEAVGRLPADAQPVPTETFDRLASTAAEGDDIALTTELAAIDHALEAGIEVQLDALRTEVLDLEVPELTTRILELDATVRAYDAAGPRLQALADYTVQAMDGADVDPVVVATMATHAALLDSALDELAALTPEGADLHAPQVRRALDAVLEGDDPAAMAGSDLLDTTALFVSGVSQHGQLNEAVTAASAALRAAALDVESGATRGAAWSAALMVAVLAAMIIGACLLTWTVERPLSALITRTRRVGAGHLDDTTLPISGPPEIAAATRAFNDVVDNLRLLEGKVRALASCRFDDPVLDERLPGPLGDELARSVTVLSGSIHDRTELQERLAHEATHDALTGLPNRGAAIEALTDRIARARRHGDIVAIAFLDLDGFKATNDTYGHAHGDEVLRQVASRLCDHFREVDFVARLGGDEFLVVLDGVDVHAALLAAQRIATHIGLPIEHDGRTVRIGVSVGLAFAQDGDDEALALLAKADLAVYRAKGSETGIALFDEALQEELRTRTNIENALRAELARGGPNLELHYQPIIRAVDESLRGFEALVRWRTDDRGLVPPGEFIPVAEASQLIVDLDRWVLGTALAQLSEWHRSAALAHVDLSVNVSGRHLLSREFASHVRDALSQVDVDPHRLIIEVTETVLLDDLVVAVENLQEVRALGVRIAVDDFGTGYTSLAHLRSLPMDELKIDRSFLTNLSEPQNRDLIRTVNELARHVGVPTIAEGIETDEQYAFLREIGCNDVQGFLFGHPAPAAEVNRRWGTQGHTVSGAPPGEREISAP